ncbi:transposase [Autumnicola edwardsiae]|uniref:Transposase n=1 Tax=Autumnicola edwardsiae TaxID=3075594 RepID=A0ABU3CYK5_9FLAO|nr:transposase [Zunongwangia sp. F297]MDT0651341.1 transposase [Zunongwangia sp. F297]
MSGFNLSQRLRNIFNKAKSVEEAYTKLAHWYKDVEETGFKAFNTVANSISLNYRSIFNYFKKCRILPLQITRIFA